MVIYCYSWYLCTNTLNYFILPDNNNINNINLMISKINSIVTIIGQINGLYRISMMIDTIHGILMRELNTEIRNAYISNTKKIIMIICIRKTDNHYTNTQNIIIGHHL